MRDLITRAYQETVALSNAHSDLKASLRTNERVPGFLTRLERELALLPARYRTPANIRATVTDLTTMFLESIERKASEARMSDAVKQGIADKAAKAKRYDELALGGEIDLDELMEVAPDGETI